MGSLTLNNDQKTTIAGKGLHPVMESYTLKANFVDDDNDDDYYWTTFYSNDDNYALTGEACAYTATYDAGTLTLNKLGKVIPKGTAVVIVASGDGTVPSINLTLTQSTATAESPDNNDLHGVDVRTDKSTLGSGTFYVMGQTDEGFGFHPYSGAYMPARKAFLRIDGGAALARMVFNDATGIKSIDNGLRTIDNESDAWYSLDGRKLSQKPTAKGVFINNGKKIVIK